MRLTNDRFAQKSLDEAVGIGTVAGAFTPLIAAGTPLPVTFTDTFSTAADHQSSVNIQLARGSENGSVSLGSVELEGVTPTLRGRPRIRVTIKIDEQGWLETSIRDLGTGREEALIATEPLPTRTEDRNDGGWEDEVEKAGRHVEATLAKRAPLRMRLAVAAAVLLLLAVGFFFVW